MAEHEEDYLSQCLEKNFCPTCQQPIKEKFVKKWGQITIVSNIRENCADPFYISNMY